MHFISDIILYPSHSIPCSDDDDEEDDDELELQLELERIRAERVAAKAKKEAEEAEEEERLKTESALMGNPLVNIGGGKGSGSAKIKRAWNDDVVFRNQSRGEPEQKKRFINDAVRSDFHKSFLRRYMGSTDR